MILNILPQEAKISLSVSLISFLSLLLKLICDHIQLVSTKWKSRGTCDFEERLEYSTVYGVPSSRFT